MKNIKDRKHPTILFIPEVGIYPYIRGLAILGDAVKKNGGQVFITHDTGQMLRTPLMAMYKTSVPLSSSEKRKIHNVTEKNFRDVQKNYDFSSIELSDLINDKIIKEINSLTDNVNADLKKIVYRGFPVGKIAEFDFILETKFPYQPNLSVEHKKLYIQYIKNTALALVVSDMICEQYKPSLFITFNEYAQCQAVRYSAKKHGIRRLALTYPVHFNVDNSRFSIWEPTNRYWTMQHIQNWKTWKDCPVQSKYVKESWKDSVYRMYSSGSHIFSTKKRGDPGVVFEKLGLDPKRKTIVAYTSSQEERRCAEITMDVWKEDNKTSDVFDNHIEWLKMLQDYVSNHDDIQIVVRVHPREGIRQYGFESQHLHLLKSKFRKRVPNFHIVWPDDPISSYDLMELADVCLIAWSTIGQEAARLGIPVLSCVSDMYYPDDDFIQTAKTRKEYYKKLDEILNMTYTWGHLVKGIRFYHWRTFIPSLDFSRFIPSDFDDRNLWPKLPLSVNKLLNNVLSGKEDLIKYNIKNWQKSLSKDSKINEKKAMKKGIRYLLDKIFYPPKNMNLVERIWRYGWRKITGNYLWIPRDSFRDYHLKYINDLTNMDDLIKKTKHNSKLRVLVADGQYAMLIHKGRILRRMSPMVIRLARLYENA